MVFGFRRIIHPSHSTSSSSSSPLHSHSRKAFGLAKKHSSANSERIGASNAADARDNWRFTESFRSESVKSLASWWAVAFFLSYRETCTCLSSSNLYPFILQNRCPDLRRYIFLLAAFSDIPTNFKICPSLYLQCKIIKLDTYSTDRRIIRYLILRSTKHQ